MSSYNLMIRPVLANDIPVSGQPTALEIDTAQKLPLFSFLEYKLTFDSTSGCMQLQISADSFVFSCVLSASVRHHISTI